MLHVIGMENTHATPYQMLNCIVQTLLTQRKPEWTVLQQHLPKPPGKGTRIMLCSFGTFVTFGCCTHEKKIS